MSQGDPIRSGFMVNSLGSCGLVDIDPRLLSLRVLEWEHEGLLMNLVD